jgi:hypothetical protein
MQANDLIKQMEIEARSNDASLRKALNEKVTQYKKAMQHLKNDSQHITVQNEKAALMNVSKGGEQRQRLLDSNDRCFNCLDLLKVFVYLIHLLFVNNGLTQDWSAERDDQQCAQKRYGNRRSWDGNYSRVGKE